jgi:hypothetical protein
MKAALLIAVLLASPAFAHAADVTVSASTKYVFETQALVLSDNPVIDLDVSSDLGHGITGDLWVQAGDKGGQELDLSAAKEWKVSTTTLNGTVGGYFYPTTGMKPIYFASLDSSTPLGPVTLELGVKQFVGDYKGTLTSIALTGTLPFSKGFAPQLTLGKAHDTGTGYSPWFGTFKVPLGQDEKSASIAVRGFWGAGSGWTLDFVKPF